MDLRDLACFVAVAEELHFGRAAERLHMAQPPLSRRIRALEDELGAPLFRRNRRRVALTDPGAALLAEARTVLAGVERARAAVAGALRGERGHLQIGFTGSAPFNGMIPRIIDALRRRHPGISVTLLELPTPEQVPALLDGRLDAGFLRPAGAAGEPRLALRPVLSEPLVVALRDDHPLAGRPAIVLADLAEEPFVLYPRSVGSALHDLVEALCRQAGFRPAVAQEARQMATLIGLVAAGLGVTLVPASIRAVHSEGVAYRPLAGIGADAGLDLALAHRAGDRSAALARFLEVVRQVADETVD